jgi:transcription elongation factor
MSDKKSLTNEAKQYIDLKDQIKFLTDRQSEIKKRLNEAVQELGEVDGRGHITLELDENITVTNQRRVSKSLNMETADKLLEERGIKDDCIVMVPTVSEDAIMAAFYKGQLSEEDIDAMFPAKVSYAFLL